MWGNLLAGVAEAAKEQLSHRASSSDGDQSQWATLASAVGTLAIDSLNRKAKQMSMPPASTADLQLAHTAAKLSAIAYLPTKEQAQAELSALGGQMLHFCAEQPTSSVLPPNEQPRSGEGPLLPQWFLGRRGAHELYLVFRGTANTDDVMRDLMAKPQEWSGLRFHSGFLGGVAGNDELKVHLRSCLEDGDTTQHLYVMGHSLGGSLAMVLPLVQGFVPPSYGGAITVVAVGSPPVLHGGEAGVDSQCVPAAARRARTMVVVNAADIVPRSLGSPLPLATSPMFQAAAERMVARTRAINKGGDEGPGEGEGGGGGGGEPQWLEPVHAQARALLAVVPEYAHLDHTSVLLLRRLPPGCPAVTVPPAERRHVLHLHESLSPNLVGDHNIDTYTAAITAALECVPPEADE